MTAGQQSISGSPLVSQPTMLVDANGWLVAGTFTQSITAGATADTTVKTSQGRLCRVLVTTAGTGAVAIYDNAGGHTGTIIGAVAANAVAGTMVECQAPASLGITVAGNAANPAMTIIWS